MSKVDHSLFATHKPPQSWGDCPQCSAKLTIKQGGTGPFLGCETYPSCEFTKPLYDYQTKTIKVIEGSTCPHCTSVLAVKKGRFGLFVGCTNFPVCNYVDDDKNTSSTHLICPSCLKGHLNERTSRFGKKFYSCSCYPDCKYILNLTPVAQRCPRCHWGVMVEKKGRIQCPQLNCGFTLEPHA